MSSGGGKDRLAPADLPGRGRYRIGFPPVTATRAPDT